MITEPTVLVLGAGASHPYSLPTANQLRKMLCVDLLIPMDSLHSSVEECGFRSDDIEKFSRAFFHSQEYSIDVFLEKNPKFLKIGKTSIAACLIPFEKHENVFNAKLEFESRTHWYQYVFHHLDCPQSAFHENQLGIVTFNYDRSFEYYLHLAIAHRYQVTADEATELMTHIPIVHVYGQLTPLKQLLKDGREYLPNFDPPIIKRAASDILLFHEEGFEENLNAARTLIHQSKRVCFLGFGYHKINVERLFPEKISKTYFGTALGMPESELAWVRAIFGPSMHLGSVHHDCLKFLQHHRVLQA